MTEKDIDGVLVDIFEGILFVLICLLEIVLSPPVIFLAICYGIYKIFF
jgi:hypothetical protein